MPPKVRLNAEAELAASLLAQLLLLAVLLALLFALRHGIRLRLLAFLDLYLACRVVTEVAAVGRRRRRRWRLGVAVLQGEYRTNLPDSACPASTC